LQKTVERIWVGNKFAEKPLGVFLIRGENVVLVGEVDEDREISLVRGPQQRWTAVDLPTIQDLDKQDREVRVEQLKMRRKLLLSRGLTSIQNAGYSLFGGFGIDVFQDDTTI
jgi:U6 snRNA-associated Sm-like protein LSm1